MKMFILQESLHIPINVLVFFNDTPIAKVVVIIEVKLFYTKISALNYPYTKKSYIILRIFNIFSK